MSGDPDRVTEVAKLHIETFRRGRPSDGIYAEEVKDHHGSSGQKGGAAGLLEAGQWLREAVPNLEVTVRSTIADPPYASVRWTIAGTHTGAPMLGYPAKGQPIEIHGGDVIKIGSDGRITDLWHVEELWKLRQQLEGEAPQV
ncbi:MAG: ester cyclase [Parvularcula sp.]|jgi:steroid delta-isomerase-like uncharacterized protein|nr:ester cyclase [Parvularcula sp.]